MTKKSWLKIALAALILTLCATTALAQDQSKGPPPFPPPPAQCLADGNGYLYVLIGPSILQYKEDNMTLIQTVTLPAPEDSKQISTSVQNPPMPPGLSWLIDKEISGEYLYIVAPRYIFRYSLPALELDQKQALPKSKALQ
jgi:hypothetical protein